MTKTEYLIIPPLETRELARIFSKFTIGHHSGCWIITTNLNHQGYGRFHFRGRQELSHRFMYALLVHPIPRGKGGDLLVELDHAVCDNPPCCNPLHLKLVTARQNNLRGNSPAATNAKRTHCINGHVLPTTPNRESKGRWRRRCLQCQQEVEARRPPRPYREAKWKLQQAR